MFDINSSPQFVALVAATNLFLGYALAVALGWGPTRPKRTRMAPLLDSDEERLESPLESFAASHSAEPDASVPEQIGSGALSVSFENDGAPLFDPPEIPRPTAESTVDVDPNDPLGLALRALAQVDLSYDATAAVPDDGASTKIDDSECSSLDAAIEALRLSLSGADDLHAFDDSGKPSSLDVGANPSAPLSDDATALILQALSETPEPDGEFSLEPDSRSSGPGDVPTFELPADALAAISASLAETAEESSPDLDSLFPAQTDSQPQTEARIDHILDAVQNALASDDEQA